MSTGRRVQLGWGPGCVERVSYNPVTLYHYREGPSPPSISQNWLSCRHQKTPSLGPWWVERQMVGWGRGHCCHNLWGEPSQARCPFLSSGSSPHNLAPGKAKVQVTASSFLVNTTHAFVQWTLFL